MNRIVSFGSSPLIHHPGLNDGLPFPNIIAQKLKLDYDCQAKALSSNPKLTRKILCHEFLPDDFALVAWTSTVRFEFRTEHGWAGFNPGTYRLEGSFAKQWYEGPGKWEYTSISIALKEIIIAQNFLKQQNIPYVFIFDNNEIFESHVYNNPDNYIDSLNKAIDWNQVVVFDDTYSMRDWCYKNQFPMTGNHANIEGQLAIADYLIEKVPAFAIKGSES